MPPMQLRSELVLVAFVLVAGCAGRATRSEAPPPKLDAEGEILGVSRRWRALEEEHGALPAQNKIQLFEIRQRSTLTLTRGSSQGEELVERKESFTLKDGRRFECRARGSVRVRVRYGRKNGVAAVEVHRPSMVLGRRCQPGDFPEPEAQISGGSSRFRLEDEQLVGIAPSSEKRSFLPLESADARPAEP